MCERTPKILASCHCLPKIGHSALHCCRSNQEENLDSSLGPVASQLITGALSKSLVGSTAGQAEASRHLEFRSVCIIKGHKTSLF